MQVTNYLVFGYYISMMYHNYPTYRHVSMASHIRNFCIIAHIDHGKSTLADRMLEITQTIRKSDKQQVLDRMDLEQERGITIKLTPARMQRKGHEFNLIDTPGHVDFQYEVSRSLAAVEGAILLVDASQGIQAQTLSVLYQAIEQGLEIIPVLNKIDLPAANPERVAKELETVIGIDADDIIAVSWKTGQNVELVLDAIIDRIQDPNSFKASNRKKFRQEQRLKVHDESWEKNLTRALIFDSVYDSYKGVVCYVKVVNGSIKSGQSLHLIHSRNEISVTELGHFSPDYVADKTLSAGQIGYIITGEKSVRDAQIGDTMLGGEQGSINDLVRRKEYDKLKEYTVPGFKKSKPFVYAGVYPIDSSDYEHLKDSLQKLSLNDSAIQYTMEDSKALGFGFRCWFLGMLHMDIIKERLRREYNLDTIFTIPTVVYLVKSKNLSIPVIKGGGNIAQIVHMWLHTHILKLADVPVNDYHSLSAAQIIEKYASIIKPRLAVTSGSDMIEQGDIEIIYEPMSTVEVVGPEEYAGSIMDLCQDYRGQLQNMEYLDTQRVVRRYKMPLGEIIIDFYDKIKSITKGYATMNYEFHSYEPNDLVKLDIFINNERIEALSWLIHKDKSYYMGRSVCEKLKELIPKHMFSIPIQAGIGNKMLARETISAMRKDVIAKCYGGDVSRKRKLLQKQKEGKKKMKALGSVQVPSDVFIKMVAR